MRWELYSGLSGTAHTEPSCPRRLMLLSISGWTRATPGTELISVPALDGSACPVTDAASMLKWY